MLIQTVRGANRPFCTSVYNCGTNLILECQARSPTWLMNLGPSAAISSVKYWLRFSKAPVVTDDHGTNNKGTGLAKCGGLTAAH